MVRTSSVFLVGVLLGCGLFPPEPQPDGSSCELDSDCESESCYGARVCAFSSCNDTGDCAAGFSCDEAPTWLEFASLGTAKGTCLPRCSVCPDGERWSCESDDDRCRFDGLPHVDAGGPYPAVVGEPVRLTATAELAPGRSIETVEWMHNGIVIGTALELDVVFEDSSDSSVEVVVTDDEEAAGMATAVLELCISAGGACNPRSGGWQCCGTEARCVEDEDDGTGSCG